MIPTRRAIEWMLVLSAGATIGLGGYTFIYARGYSYLSNNPAACANCHVMNEYYDSWIKSPHRNAAACNDCHTPHDWIGKYSTKAMNGFAHSFAFTSGRFPDSIAIKDRSREITEHACRSCHASVVDAIEGPHAGELSCIRCHADAGHL